MAGEYLQTLHDLLDRQVFGPGPDVSIECKHFFGGAAAYANGRIFMTWTDVGLALKLPEDARTILIGEGAVPLRYFPQGPIKHSYVVVPERLAADEAALAKWIGESVRFSQISPKPRS